MLKDEPQTAEDLALWLHRLSRTPDTKPQAVDARTLKEAIDRTDERTRLRGRKVGNKYFSTQIAVTEWITRGGGQ